MTRCKDIDFSLLVYDEEAYLIIDSYINEEDIKKGRVIESIRSRARIEAIGVSQPFNDDFHLQLSEYLRVATPSF
jgi:hypothetical protein